MSSDVLFVDGLSWYGMQVGGVEGRQEGVEMVRLWWMGWQVWGTA